MSLPMQNKTHFVLLTKHSIHITNNRRIRKSALIFDNQMTGCACAQNPSGPEKFTPH